MRRPETSLPMDSTSDSDNRTLSVIASSRPLISTRSTTAACTAAADRHKTAVASRRGTGRMAGSIPAPGVLELKKGQGMKGMGNEGNGRFEATATPLIPHSRSSFPALRRQMLDRRHAPQPPGHALQQREPVAAHGVSVYVDHHLVVECVVLRTHARDAAD